MKVVQSAMATENKEIGEIVKKSKILLLDIEGTTTSISFVKDKLFPYAEENVKQFLDSQWEADDVKEAVTALRKLALEDREKSVDGVVTIPGEDASKEDQIEGLVKSVKWQMSADRKAGALKMLQGLIWKQGYDSGDIQGHVYDDVSAALEQWRSADGRKVYIYSSGSVQAQKLLFGQSLAGDLLKFIDGHFDTAVGAKQEPASYTAIAESIGAQPADVLYLTDIPKEAEAARSAGLNAALVSREGNAPLPSEATQAFAVLHSLAQLAATNKRKPDPQDELPTKVPKTDTDDDVKTALASDEKAPEKEVQVEEEKMEVEEAPVVKDTEEKLNFDKPIVTDTIIEDVTNKDEALDVPMVEVEPVIADVNGEKSDAGKKVEVDMEATKSTEVKNEVNENKIKSDEIESKPSNVESKPNDVLSESDEVVKKVDKNITKPGEDLNKNEEVLGSSAITPRNGDTEEAKTIENNESKINDKEQKQGPVELKEQINTEIVKENVKIAEETPPTVITEIEEITTDNLGDMAEMMEDLEPIVEEPTSEEMEDLQNVGEVLEKECDEILSKVQDVTNLDNIPLKPLLNTIAEETMESELDTETMDSNDIVDRILDTELELEQCNDIDLNTVSEITDDTKMEEPVDTKLTGKMELEANPEIEEKVESLQNTETGPLDSTATDDIKNTEKVESNEKQDDTDKTAVENNEKLGNNDEIENNDKDTKKSESSVKAINDDKAKDEMQNKEKMEINDKPESSDVTEISNNVESADKVESNNTVEEQVPQPEEGKSQPENIKNEENKLPESMDTETAGEDVTSDSAKDNDSKVNGKTTNGNAESANVNGDSKNTEELNSRLSVENGKETVNGSNGDSVDTEKGQGDKVEAEVSDIKVKTVAAEEPRTDPIEQPTEA